MSIFNATTKEGRARIRSDVHQRTWNLGGDPFTNGEGIVRLLDACKALEKEIAGRDARIASLQLDKDDTIEAYRGALTAFLERRIKG